MRFAFSAQQPSGKELHHRDPEAPRNQPAGVRSVLCYSMSLWRTLSLDGQRTAHRECDLRRNCRLALHDVERAREISRSEPQNEFLILLGLRDMRPCLEGSWGWVRILHRASALPFTLTLRAEHYMRTSSRFLLITLLLASVLQRSAWAVSIGQVDNFEDGTTQGWLGGLGAFPNPAPPLNALGGPAGANDNYLLLTALGGNGPASKLSVLNLSQWSGNYIAAGVGSITMDLRNLGSTDLSLRLALEDPVGGPPSNIAFSGSAFLLPAGGGWTTAVFPIAPSDLLPALGSINTALTNTTAIRLYHSPAPNVPNPVFPIASVVAQLGVDNIRAGANVPDGGSTAILLLSTFLGVGYFRRRIR